MKNRKTVTLSLLLIVLIAVAALAYYVLRPTQANAPSDGPAGSSSAATGTYTEHTAYADIEAAFATSTPLRQAAGDRANAAAVLRMKQFVDDTIAKFKIDANLANLTPADVETRGLSEDRKYDLQVHYLSSAGPRSVSYIFQIDSYTLGAHGNTFFRTFTFDLESGKELSLADLFVPDSSYIEKLSALSRKMLPALVGEYLDKAMLADGTTADSKNFEAFFLDGTSFVIIFPPYAVAPYVAGPQTLAIPLTALADVLKPAYR